MTYTYENETGRDDIFDFPIETVYHNAVDTVLQVLDCPYETCVNLLVTDDEGIRQINKDMRQIDAPTDVLSFPMSEYPMPGSFDHLTNDPDAFDPDSGELLLGDIVVSADHIIKNANEYGHSTKRECAFLIVHSMLHLTGFDHMEESDRIRMEEMQDQIMEILGISR